jgi:Ca2+/Na+ antiporter
MPSWRAATEQGSARRLSTFLFTMLYCTFSANHLPSCHHHYHHHHHHHHHHAHLIISIILVVIIIIIIIIIEGGRSARRLRTFLFTMLYCTFSASHLEAKGGGR